MVRQFCRIQFDRGPDIGILSAEVTWCSDACQAKKATASGKSHSLLLCNMVSFQTLAVTPQQFDSWITPPKDPKEKKKREEEGEDEDEVLAGEGFSMDINHLDCCKEITDAVAGRAIDYCESGRGSDAVDAVQTACVP